jgi:hypothetical protein
MIAEDLNIGLHDMARGPKGEYRPKDPMAAAAAVARIATGQSDEKTETARAIAAEKTSEPKPNQKPKIRLRTIER